MAGLDLPTLVQRVRLNADTRDGESEFKGSLDRIGSSMTKVGVGLTAALTVPIVGLAISGVKAASDLAESNSKVGVVFEENAGKVRAFASTAASSLGISEQAALEATGTFGNLFRALGVGTGPAAEMSTSLVTLAADLASFNNANPEDVLLALRSGLLGEAEPLRQFGVSLSAARIEAEAMSSGLVKATGDTTKITTATIAHEKAQAAAQKALAAHGKESLEYRDATAKVAKAEEALAAATAGKVPELTAAQKAQAAFNIIQKDTALAQGDFARTSDGLANQQRILAAQFVDLKASLASELLPVVSRAAGLFISLFKAIEGLNPEGERLAKIGLAIAAAIGPLLIVGGQLAKSFGAIKAVIGGGGFLLGLGPLLPIALGVAAVGVLIWKNWDKVRPILEKVAEMAKYAFDIFRNAFQAGDDFGMGGWVGRVAKAGEMVRKVFDAVSQGIATFRTGLTEDDVPTPLEKVALFLREKVLPIVSKVVGFIRDNWKPIVIGAFIAFGPPVLAVAGLMIVLYKRFEGLRNILTTVVTFIMGTVVPTVMKFASIIGRYVGNIVDYFEGIAPQVKEALGHVLRVVSTVLEFMKDVIQGVLGVVAALWRAWGDDIWNIVKALFKAIGEVIRGALGVIKGVIQTVLAVINGDWGKAWDGIKMIVDGAFDAIFGLLRGAMSIIQSVFGGIASTVSEIWRGLWEFIKGVLSGAWNFIVDSILRPVAQTIGGIFGGIRDAIVGVWNGITGFLRGTWDAIAGMARGTWSFIGGIIGGAVDWVRDRIRMGMDGIRWIIEGVWGHITGFLRGTWDWIGGMAAGIWGHITRVIGGAMDWVRGHIDGVIGAVIGSFDFLQRVVRWIMGGAGDWFRGIIGAVDWVRDHVWNGIKAIGDFIGGLPRRVMDAAFWVFHAAKQLGENVLNGISDGVRGAMGFLGDVGRTVGNAVIRIVNDQIIRRINDIRFDLFGKTIDFPDVPFIPMLAKGGPFAGPFIAGERGPELVIPNASRGQVIDARRSEDLLSRLVTGMSGQGGSGGSLIGNQVIHGLTPEQVTQATLRAYRKMALEWEVA